MLGFGLLAVAAPRTWTFQTGVTVAGDYVSSGTTMVVIRNSGTNCFLKISDLSTNDRIFVAQMQLAQRQARLDAGTNQMARAGRIELTAKLIENFPEKVEDKPAWMDAEFDQLEPGTVDFQDVRLGFSIRDKNGDWFLYCYVNKNLPGPNYPSNFEDWQPNPLVSAVTSLKHGDKIRLIGKVGPISASAFLSEWNYRRYFEIEKLEIIETAAEKKAREEIGENQP